MHKLIQLTVALGFALTGRAVYTPLAADLRSLDVIYAAAKNESGPLQVFLGGDAGSQGDGIREAWKARFPDIALNLTVDLSKYHDNRIDRAHLQGIHVADVVALQTLQDFPRWKAEGILLEYKPSTFDDLIAGKDYDGAYLPIAINGFGTFSYDSSKITDSEIPTSYETMPDKQFHGRLVLTYPNDDDAVCYLFSLIVSRYGFQWLYDLAKNNVKWVRGTATPAYKLLAAHNTTSKRALTFTSFGQNPNLGSKAIAAPEQNMMWAQTAAIIAGTPRPESAKLFMSWLTSYERLNTTTGYTVLTSLNEKNGLNPYATNTSQISGFNVFEQDRARVEWWNNLFEEVLGTPQGEGPIQMYPNPPYNGSEDRWGIVDVFS